MQEHNHNSLITGVLDRGWHIRLHNGVPEYWEVRSIQVPRSHFVVLSLTYPKGTSFKVTVQQGRCPGGTHNIPQASSLNQVLQPREELNDWQEFNCDQWFSIKCKNTGGVGPAWYYDGNTGNFYLRVVDISYYAGGTGESCDTYKHTGYFERNGMFLKVVDHSMYRWRVAASCPGWCA
eukprot:scaffold2973_cov325-Prasinococcus_capsulatus_cf.AAC.5